jgi:hypothetical protein
MEAVVQKRRSRGVRTATGKRVRPTERDIIWFQKIQEHGPLPTSYLYEFTKHLTPTLGVAKNRLSVLFHEDRTEHGGPYLDRPGQDYSNVTLFQEDVYDLTRAAEIALEAAGFPVPAKRRENHKNYQHEFMASCTAASTEIAVRDDQHLEWISQDAVLKNSPTQSLKVPCSISRNGITSTRSLIPDGLFGIKYPGPKFRVFAIEDDRSNEPWTRANLDETSYLAKFLRYREVIEGGTYKEHYGIKSGMLVLNIMVSARHAQNVMDNIMKETDGRGCPYMLFKSVPCFANRITVPPVMRELVTTPWVRAGFPPININKID